MAACQQFAISCGSSEGDLRNRAHNWLLLVLSTWEPGLLPPRQDMELAYSISGATDSGQYGGGAEDRFPEPVDCGRRWVCLKGLQSL